MDTWLSSQTPIDSPEFTRFLVGELAVCLKDGTIPPQRRAQALLARVYRRTASLMRAFPGGVSVTPEMASVIDFTGDWDSPMRLHARLVLDGPGLASTEWGLMRCAEATAPPPGLDPPQRRRLAAVFRALKGLGDMKVWNSLQPIRFVTAAPFLTPDGLEQAMARDLDPLLVRFRQRCLDQRLPVGTARSTAPAPRL